MLLWCYITRVVCTIESANSSGPLRTEAGTKGCCPFPAPLSPLAASLLRYARTGIPWRAEHFSHIEMRASLRWCSVHPGITVRLRQNPQWRARKAHEPFTPNWRIDLRASADQLE